MTRRPPRATRTDTRLPYATLLRSAGAGRLDGVEIGGRRAHRAFGDLADRPLGVGELEDEQFGIADRPAHLIGEVDDALVAGQHEIGVARVGRADLHRADRAHVLHPHLLARRGQRPFDAGTDGARIAAERSEEHTYELQSLLPLSYAV